MTKAVCMAAMVAVLSAPVTIATPAYAQEALPADFTEIVAQTSTSVVGIAATRPAQQAATRPLPEQFRIPGLPQSPRQQPRGGGRALGSGFVISDQGHIVTNNHVVQEAEEVEVLLEDGSTRPAEIVGTDPATDLAVLQIESIEDLTVANWGDSDALQPGAWTIAIGSPFGLGGTVTVGVLSARSRDIRSGPYDDYLQTDASINSGNSGGPLFNGDGQVIGVNTAIFSPVGANIGIGFAVPSSTAQDVVSQLIETGNVERGFIGITMQPVTEPISRALELDSTNGALVTGIEEDSPAASAGLNQGDVIVELDGEAVEDPRELSRRVGQLEPGNEITLSIQRDGDMQEVELTLAERNPQQRTASTEQGAAPSEDSRIGIAVSPIPDVVRQQLGIRRGVGVIVQNVQPQSPGDEAGLQSGDVILQAGNTRVSSGDDLIGAWRHAQDADRPMLLMITRGETSSYVAVETGQS